MFSITPYYKEKELTLYLEGTLDISTVSQWEKTFEKSGNLSEMETCKVDFTNLSFIDSTGIGALLDLIHLASHEGFTIEFENMSDAIFETLEVVGLFDIKNALMKGVS